MKKTQKTTPAQTGLRVLACRFEDLAPWRKYDHNEVFEIALSNGQMAECIILGKRGGEKGLAVYIGEQSRACLARFLCSRSVGLEPMFMEESQDCLAVICADTDDYEGSLPTGRKGKRGRSEERFGREDILRYIARMEPCYVPVDLTEAEEEVMTEVLLKLLAMLEEMPGKKTIRDHGEQNGMVIYRRSLEVDGGIETTRTSAGSYKENEKGEIPEEKKFVLKSAARKKSGKILELGTYFTEDIYVTDDGRDYYERCALLAEHTDPTALAYRLLQPTDNCGQVMTDMLIDYILESGMPEEVCVPDLRYAKRLKALTSFLKLKITVSDLPVVHRMYDAVCMGIEDLDDMLLTEEEMDEMADFLFDSFGLDKNKIRENAEKLSPEEFQNYMEGQLMDSLLSGKFPPIFSDPDDPDDDDLPWGDGQFEDTFPVFYEDNWRGCANRREKVEAVEDFYGVSRLFDIEDIEEYYRTVFYDEPTLTWKEALMQGTKKELLEMAKRAGVRSVSTQQKKEVIATALVQDLEERFRGNSGSKAVRDLIGEGAADLVAYVEEKVRMQNMIDEAEDLDELDDLDDPGYWMDTDDEFEEFPFTMSDILTALQWGLIDVDGDMDDEEIALLLKPVKREE